MLCVFKLKDHTLDVRTYLLTRIVSWLDLKISILFYLFIISEIENKFSSFIPNSCPPSSLTMLVTTARSSSQNSERHTRPAKREWVSVSSNNDPILCIHPAQICIFETLWPRLDVRDMNKPSKIYTTPS